MAERRRLQIEGEADFKVAASRWLLGTILRPLVYIINIWYYMAFSCYLLVIGIIKILILQLVPVGCVFCLSVCF